MKRIALALWLIAPPTQAQEVERVTVYGGSLSGFWHVMSPGSIGISLFGKTEWGALRPSFCRISHDGKSYVTHCFRQRGEDGRLAVDGRHFHLAWGTMLARLTFDGEVTSATGFEGRFTGKLAGMAIRDPDLSEGTKITPDPAAPDDKAGLLRGVLNGEAVAHDSDLEDALAAARAMHLGNIENISLLGRQRKPETDDARTPVDLAVYAVEFAEGERICWLHQDDDGRLDTFQCG